MTQPWGGDEAAWRTSSPHLIALLIYISGQFPALRHSCVSGSWQVSRSSPRASGWVGAGGALINAVILDGWRKPTLFHPPPFRGCWSRVLAPRVFLTAEASPDSPRDIFFGRIPVPPVPISAAACEYECDRVTVAWQMGRTGNTACWEGRRSLIYCLPLRDHLAHDYFWNFRRRLLHGMSKTPNSQHHCENQASFILSRSGNCLCWRIRSGADDIVIPHRRGGAQRGIWEVSAKVC